MNGQRFKETDKMHSYYNMCWYVSITVLFIAHLWTGVYTCTSLSSVKRRYQLPCMCRPQHPQESYCDADFVILGRVTDVEKVEAPSPIIPEYNDYAGTNHEYAYRYSSRLYNKIIYTVEVEERYKGNHHYLVPMARVPITSRYVSDYCIHVPLYLNYSYIIMGNQSTDDELLIDRCSFYRLSDQVTSHEVDGFRRHYKKTCNQCMVCHNTNGCGYDEADGCTVGKEMDLGLYYFNKTQCEHKYARCSRKKRTGRCDWIGNGIFRYCKRQRKKEIRRWSNYNDKHTWAEYV
ncbi:metalloproteinase inhibitor 3-like isoform X2 [Apostichopus japonicus]|uniref:metalloproteinase inhibitor 3-like isoform X2 n=1 Tax=Stichopus japonicus TaxID=307972 RepID=UPI003AB8344F